MNREAAMRILKAKLYQIEHEKKRQAAEADYGKKSDVAFGSQIRSYVFQPYQLVKDHRTGHATGNVQDVMDGNLDAFIEAKLRGHLVDREELRNEIMPVFRKRDGKTTDVIVLGCTHYPLLLDDIRAVEPWPVSYIDPAPAIARRVSDLLRSNGTTPSNGSDASTVFLTSHRGKAAETLLAYASMGFANNEIIDLPV